MRHGSPPRLLALQSILSPNRRESLPTLSAGVRITGVEAAFGSSNILQRQGSRSVPCPRTGLILTCDGPSLTISWSLCAPTCTMMKVVHGAQGKSAREDGTRPCSDDL